MRTSLSLLTAALAATACLTFTAASRADDYPLKTCVVTGEKLEAEAFDYHHNGRLVRFCCKDCLDEFKKNPQKFLKKLDDAARKAAPKAS